MSLKSPTSNVERGVSFVRAKLDAIDQLSTFKAILVIAILSLLVKAAYITFLGAGWNTFPTEGTDGSFYDSAARVLLETGVYALAPAHPTTQMPPGQSYFLALVYAFSGYSVAFAKLAHVALLTAVAILTYFTARGLVGHAVGLGAGVLVAVDPSLAYLSGTFLSDALFIFLMVVGIYFLVRQTFENHVVSWVVVGISFGLAGLTRNQGWLFAIALCLGALVTLGRLTSLRASTVVLLATLLTVAPWTWRNYQVMGQFIPVSSEGGLTLWASNNPEFVFRPPMPMSGPLYDAPSNLTGPEIDQYYRRRAIEWITSHPTDFIVDGFRKLVALYSFDPMSWRPEVAGLYRLAGIFPYGLLLPFILFGLIKNLKNPRFFAIIWYILFTSVMAFVFYGDSRIRAPIQPYLYIFGVLGIQITARWLNLAQPTTPVNAAARSKN